MHFLMMAPAVRDDEWGNGASWVCRMSGDQTMPTTVAFEVNNSGGLQRLRRAGVMAKN
jgi:hypothetical protein